MLRLIYFLTISFILSYYSCTQTPDFPVEPVISNFRLNKDSLVQGLGNQDSIQFIIDFTDGDGDLGSNDSLNIFILDNRDGSIFEQFQIPFIPEAGANNGIQGTITAFANSTCCVYPNMQPPCSPSTEFPTNELTFTIYIKDRAGNESNHLVSPIITLLCQ